MSEFPQIEARIEAARAELRTILGQPCPPGTTIGGATAIGNRVSLALRVLDGEVETEALTLRFTKE